MRHGLCKDEVSFSSVLTSSCPSHFSSEAPGLSSQGSCLLASPLHSSVAPSEGKGRAQGPLPSPGPHGSAMWKRHDAEGEAPMGPQAHEASMPPTPPHLSFLWSRGHWGSRPHHNLVSGLGCDGSFSVSGPQAGPGSFLVPFLSPSKPSPWLSEKLVSSVRNYPILPLPVPLQPKGGSGRLPPLSNPHFT